MLTDYQRSLEHNKTYFDLGKQIHVRLGGCQIAIAHDVSKNVETLKRAIDWAAENNVEYLITPEGALSGYFDNALSDENWPKVKKGEEEIVAYATSKEVGLGLGTFWREPEVTGTINRNQTRFYNWMGHFEGSYNKIMLIESDIVIPGEDTAIMGGEHKTIKLTPKSSPQSFFQVGVLICNDFYGENREGTALARRALYSLKNMSRPVELIIHPTFGLRGYEVHDDLDEEIMKTYELWHENHVKQLSYSASMSVLTVDTISDFTGQLPPNIDTSSPGGVVVNGKTIVSAPRRGEQYFHWDYLARCYGGDTPEHIINTPGVLEAIAANNPKPVEE